MPNNKKNDVVPWVVFYCDYHIVFLSGLWKVIHIQSHHQFITVWQVVSSIHVLLSSSLTRSHLHSTSSFKNNHYPLLLLFSSPLCSAAVTFTRPGNSAAHFSSLSKHPISWFTLLFSSALWISRYLIPCLYFFQNFALFSYYLGMLYNWNLWLLLAKSDTQWSGIAYESKT